MPNSQNNFRKTPLSDDELDAIIAASPGRKWEGVVRRYWRQERGYRGVYVDGGGLIDVTQLRMRIGEASCSGLPCGTRITIDIPPGVTPPFSRFCTQPMRFRAETEEGIEWETV